MQKILTKYAWFNSHTKSYYCVCNIPHNGKTTVIRIHRFILGINNKKILVDHFNHDTLNNTRENLRTATNSENEQNQIKAHKNNKSGVMGVNYNEKTGRYRAEITINKKLTHLGLFDTAQEAFSAYLDAKKKYHGYAVVENIT